MPWMEAVLRGQRVLARVKTDGSFEVDGGRVEIRYNPKDGRAYRASPANLAVAAGAPLLSDDTCAPVHELPSAAKGDRSTARAGRVPDQSPLPPGAWIAYTDGACSGNPGPAGCGVVLVGPDGAMHEGLEYLGHATNNVAELTAILRAVEWIPLGAAAVVVHTDSQYAIGVLQKGWKAKANQDLVSRTRIAVKNRGARLLYVPGHQGVVLNERADQLAREAVQTGRSHPAVVRSDAQAKV